jgi:hypothetical protein
MPAYKMIRVRLEDYNRLKAAQELIARKGTDSINPELVRLGIVPLEGWDLGELVRAGAQALVALRGKT